LKITVHGGAREIGGSCIEVQTEDCKVALDYGTTFEESSGNRFPEDFDAVIISHAHLDHSGQLLSLSKKKPVIVGSKITREVTLALLHDMVKVQSQNNYNYPYFKHDANRVLEHWWVRDYVALPGMTIKLIPAGHVAGARMTSIHSEDKEVLYTGDFCVHDSEILEGCNTQALPKKPDVLITESTYGGKIRSPFTEAKRWRRELMKLWRTACCRVTMFTLYPIWLTKLRVTLTKTKSSSQRKYSSKNSRSAIVT
jgi:putative mRNA 3-end processing factor